ncbi:MAG: hypothetical protein M3400_08580 [Actinomycetota bacterium]|nr:hypothetical protein [Actinomycetota bacterium]
MALTGCGISAEDRPSPIAITPPSPPTGIEQPPAGALTVLVYFVRGDVLEPVERSVLATNFGTDGAAGAGIGSDPR